MNKIWLLVTNYFNNYIGNLGRSKNKTKYALGGGILLFVGAMSILLFASMAITTMETALSMEQPYPELSLYITMGMMCMFLLLLIVTRATVNKKHNDEELLLSLPFKKSHIVISKILYNYLFDFICVASTLIPSCIVYYVYMYNSTAFSTPDIGFFPRFMYLLLLIPMLSNAIGSLIGLLFQQLTKSFRNVNVIRSLISVVFIVLFLIGYYALQYYLQMVTTLNSDFSIESIIILKGLVDFVIGKEWILSGITMTLTCVIPFIICVMLQSIFIGKETSYKTSKNKKLKFGKTTIVGTLLKQEVGRYFNSSVYVINTLFGGIILIILSGAYALFGKEFITDKVGALATIKIDFILPYVELIFISLGIMTISTCSISASSISMEGKNLWIIKAHPVKISSVFLSKILCHFLICFACIVPSTIFLGIRFIYDNSLLGIIYTIGFFILIVIHSLINAVLGLLINLIFPKLEWTNETDVIKQSISSAIALFAGAFIAILIIAPYILIYKFLDPSWYILVIFVLELIVLGILIILISTVGKKLYRKL